MTILAGEEQLRGVIFDVDGVLVLSEPITAEGVARIFAEQGAKVVPDDIQPFIGQGEDRILSGVAEAKGVAIDVPEAKAKLAGIYRELVPGRLQSPEGLRPFLEQCRARGLKIALASSGNIEKVRTSLDAIHLPLTTFDKIVTGDKVEHKKPAPDLFLEAARQLDLDPSACLVIEDAVAGVEAAKTAGMRCLALTTSFSADQLTKADWTAPDFAHAPSETLEW